MNCQACGSRKVSVVDSRPMRLGIRRRRCCRKCGERWTTYEIREEQVLGFQAHDQLAKHIKAMMSEGKACLTILK